MNTFRHSIFASLLLLCSPAWAVDCTPEVITLTSQTDVDNFQTNHGPGCDTVVKSLTIEGGSINDLTPLAGLTNVSTGGPYGFETKFVINNTSLTNLAGLESLANVFWVDLSNNTSLTSLAALANLDTVRGPLFINGNTALTNLNGLQGVTQLGGALFIENNTLLNDLSGVSNIQSINASLVINNNDALLDLEAFSGLTQLGSNISIQNNDLLTSLDGLRGLSGFTASINIRYNNQLSSIGNLTNIDQLNGLVIWSNPKLVNLDGLDNLTHVGDGTALALKYNNTLSNIEALSSLVSVAFDVEITDNPMLDDCSPLVTLLDDVDDAKPGPGPGGAGIPDVGGDVTLANNLPGCNSLPEPPIGSFAYGAFGGARPHLLFKGLSVALNCFDSPLQIPGYGTLPSNRVQFSCSAIPFQNTDTLIYDVTMDKCASYQAFEMETDLFTDGIYFEHDNTGASLQEQSDAAFLEDENALLFFDPQSGELRQGQSMVCADPGPPLRIFKDGFE